MSLRARDATISAQRKMEKVEEMITRKKQEDTSSKNNNFCKVFIAVKECCYFRSSLSFLAVNALTMRKNSWLSSFVFICTTKPHLFISSLSFKYQNKWNEIPKTKSRVSSMRGRLLASRLSNWHMINIRSNYEYHDFHLICKFTWYLHMCHLISDCIILATFPSSSPH